MINISGLKFQYSDSSFSLSIPNLKLPASKIISLSGPSGSGKSTFLKLISGELTPLSGEINLDSVNVTALSSGKLRNFRLQNLGIVYQKPSLIDWMSTKDNILLPYRFTAQAKELDTKINRISEKLGIDKLLKRTAGQLSIGEQFRVSIVRALAGSKKYILADEPTANLDENLREKTIRFLIEYCRNNEITLIIVSHNKTEIELTDLKLSSENWVLA